MFRDDLQLDDEVAYQSVLLSFMKETERLLYDFSMSGR
jgi:hypothetical protein